MGEWCGEHNVEVWAYCLMPNHVHLIVVSKTEDGLRRAIGEARRRYTRRVNSRVWYPGTRVRHDPTRKAPLDNRR